ncbi:uncharacterized protein LOC144069335 [Stigmatopora argus]
MSDSYPLLLTNASPSPDGRVVVPASQSQVQRLIGQMWTNDHDQRHYHDHGHYQNHGHYHDHDYDPAPCNLSVALSTDLSSFDLHAMSNDLHSLLPLYLCLPLEQAQ